MEILLSPRLVTQTSRPSGEIHMPSVPGPVGMAFAFPVPRSITLTVPEPVFETYNLLPSRDGTSKWPPRCPVGQTCSTCPEAVSTSVTAGGVSLVTQRYLPSRL